MKSYDDYLDDPYVEQGAWEDAVEREIEEILADKEWCAAQIADIQSEQDVPLSPEELTLILYERAEERAVKRCGG